MKIGEPLPPLDGPGVTWLHDGSAAGRRADGAVTLVHFFSISCELCKTQLPDLLKLRDRFEKGGLRLVGVHMPRYPEDVDLPRVKAVVEEYGLTHPVAVDDEHTITDRFENEFVPSYYTFDRKGALAHKKAGETALEYVGQAIERLLKR
jgi:thiol-disulfide isomerase/thioredoxin